MNEKNGCLFVVNFDLIIFGRFWDVCLCLIVLVVSGKYWKSIEFVINLKFICPNLVFVSVFSFISSLIQFLTIFILSKNLIFFLGTYI